MPLPGHNLNSPASMSHSKLSIAFLLGSPDISGGTYVIFEHTTHLISFGHKVTIVTEEQPLLHRLQWHPKAGDLDWLTMYDTTSVRFDIVIATWWKSPFLLNKLNGTHYIYFVQSIESRFFHDEYIIHDQNSFVTARDDEEEVVRLLKILKNSPEELQRIKMGTRQSAATWVDWPGAALEFEGGGVAGDYPATADESAISQLMDWQDGGGEYSTVYQ